MAVIFVKMGKFGYLKQEVGIVESFTKMFAKVKLLKMDGAEVTPSEGITEQVNF